MADLPSKLYEKNYGMTQLEMALHMDIIRKKIVYFHILGFSQGPGIVNFSIKHAISPQPID
jgi:hypothetical protein